MTINERKNEIIVTKAEYAKAMKVGTKEFERLFKARQMYPNAKVVIKKSNNKQNYSKLTKKFMLEYVEATDKEYLEELKQMFDLIGRTRFDEKKNEVITELLSKIGLLQITQNDGNSGKIFGLFRR